MVTPAAVQVCLCQSWSQRAVVGLHHSPRDEHPKSLYSQQGEASTHNTLSKGGVW